MKYYDDQEKDIIESFEKSKWTSLKGKKTTYKKIAEENLKKSIRINIRLTAKDLKDIRRLAALEGIPYQTFIASILHKYSKGNLLDKKTLSTSKF